MAKKKPFEACNRTKLKKGLFVRMKAGISLAPLDIVFRTLRNEVFEYGRAVTLRFKIKEVGDFGEGDDLTGFQLLGRVGILY